MRSGLPFYRVSTLIEQYLITQLVLVLALLLHTAHLTLRQGPGCGVLRVRVTCHDDRLRVHHVAEVTGDDVSRDTCSEGSGPRREGPDSNYAR